MDQQLNNATDQVVDAETNSNQEVNQYQNY